jgi:tetratricopeptide (TPR) repeat protein
MRPLIVALVALASVARVDAADPLAEARRLYNAGQYQNAARMAKEALAVPALADSARIVLGRVLLERFRQTASAEDLNAARDAFRNVDPQALDNRDQLELTVGLAETLYLDNRFGAAAQLFETVLDRAGILGPGAHDRVLDWWATAVDRQAQLQPPDQRGPAYARVLDRMRLELARDPVSTPASYWLTAAARGSGDLDLAWHSAAAGWVRAGFARDRGAALRADLDRFVLQAIIPERAAKLQIRDTRQAQSGMISEWEAFKANWSK